MKKCNVCLEDKSLDLFYKAKTGQHGVEGRCKVCSAAAKADARMRDYAASLQREADIRQRRADSIREAQAAYHARNREDILKKRRERYAALGDTTNWIRANPEKVKQYKDKWKLSNPHKLSAGSRKRCLVRKQATPSWTSSEFEQLAMSEAYALARLRSEVTGFEWHVDHKVPLQSKAVCGLHCTSNLQIITAKENLAKSNIYWEDMP